MQPLASIRSNGKLLAYALIPPPLRRVMSHALLKKYYLMDVEFGQPHGCWRILARKA